MLLDEKFFQEKIALIELLSPLTLDALKAIIQETLGAVEKTPVEQLPKIFGVFLEAMHLCLKKIDGEAELDELLLGSTTEESDARKRYLFACYAYYAVQGKVWAYAPMQEFFYDYELVLSMLKRYAAAKEVFKPLPLVLIDSAIHLCFDKCLRRDLLVIAALYDICQRVIADSPALLLNYAPLALMAFKKCIVLPTETYCTIFKLIQQATCSEYELDEDVANEYESYPEWYQCLHAFCLIFAPPEVLVQDVNVARKLVGKILRSDDAIEGGCREFADELKTFIDSELKKQRRHSRGNSQFFLQSARDAAERHHEFMLAHPPAVLVYRFGLPQKYVTEHGMRISAPIRAKRAAKAAAAAKRVEREGTPRPR